MEASPTTNTYNANSGVTMGIDALGLTEEGQGETAEEAPSKQTNPTSATQSTDTDRREPTDCQTHPLDPNYHSTCQNEKLQSPKSPDCLSPKHSRRVSFPVDSTVVSGYMDPPNPWHEPSTCTTDELITAYKAACEKHNVKPIPKLLNQLMAISNFCDRNETFTLKGEKLDAKHCETLEEVLRRVQFRTIDVENTHLDDESAVALFDMVEYYESCTRLNISHNKNIGIRGWQSCARMTKKTPCIDCLEARNCALTEQVMPMLGRALRMGSQLTTLHLENAILSGRPLMILVTAIKMNEILRELYLADNKLMPSDGIQLGNMLKYNHKLQLLDIRNNHLQDDGTSHLCDGLFEQNLGQGLNTLVLWNNQVTYQSMPSLARALVNTLSLETLNLGHNNITNEGVHRLKDGLLHNKSLLRIGLQAAKISCEGSVALAEFIADSPRLLRVDLRENDIKTGGLMALSLALKVSQTVTRVDLDKDTKRESGVKDYADQQRRLQQDIQNLMLRNRDLARQREAEAELERQAEAEAAQAELAAAEARLELQEEEKKEEEEPEEQILLEVKEPEEEVETVRPPLKQLSLELPSRIQTLESPGFVTEADLPIMSPPTEEQVASEVAALTAAVAVTDIPQEFPPSPMTSQPKTLFGALIEQSSQQGKGASPNTRRKFIISKVVEDTEEAGPSVCPAAKDQDKSTSCSQAQPESQGAQASPPTPACDPSEAGAETQEVAEEGGGQQQEQLCSNGNSSAATPEHESDGAQDTSQSCPQTTEPEANNSASAETTEESLMNGASGSVSGEEAVPAGAELTADGNGTAASCSSEEVGPEAVQVEVDGTDTPVAARTDCEEAATTAPSLSLHQSPGGDATTTTGSTGPNFHTNLSLNGMKVELATVLDTLEKTGSAKVTAEESVKAKNTSVEAAD